MNIKKCVVIFLDVSKALDSMSQGHLIKIIKETAKAKRHFSTICELLLNNQVFERKRSPSISILKELGQGLPSPLTLSNSAIHFVLQSIRNVWFADDIAFVAKCEDCELCLRMEYN